MEGSRSAGVRTHWQYKNNQTQTPADKNTQTQTICIGIYTRANLKTFQTQKTTRAITTMTKTETLSAVRELNNGKGQTFEDTESFYKNHGITFTGRMLSPSEIIHLRQQKRQILAAAIAESIAKNMQALCLLAKR